MKCEQCNGSKWRPRHMLMRLFDHLALTCGNISFWLDTGEWPW